MCLLVRHLEFSLLRLSERSLGERLVTVYKYLHKEKVPGFSKGHYNLLQKRFNKD